MKVLLLYNVENIGNQGEIHDVSRGYARNYLIPKRLAILPTKGSQRLLQLAKRKTAKIEAEMQEVAAGIKNAIDELGPLEITAKANDEGKLYGSVTKTVIKNLLKEKNINIDTKNIALAHPIKQTGDYDIPVELFKTSTTIRLAVKPEDKKEKVEEEKSNKNEGNSEGKQIEQ